MPGSPAGRLGGRSRETEPAAGRGAAANRRMPNGRSKRSWNSHQLRLKELPHFSRLRREEPFLEADWTEWHAAAGRIAGPACWYSVAGIRADWGCELIHFATKNEAEQVQRWIAESGIETRPAPDAYRAAALGVAGTEPS